MSSPKADWVKRNDSPPPGSDNAREQGCTCPIFDNCRGEGGYFGGYIISEDCPIHGSENPKDDTEKDAKRPDTE